MLERKTLAGAVLVGLALSGPVLAQVASFTKAQVGDRIRKVEDGVDEFRNWSENRAERDKAGADSPGRGAHEGPDHDRVAEGGGQGEEGRIGRSPGGSESVDEPAAAQVRPLGQVDGDAAQVENVLEDGRRINQALVRGKYGTQAERYWSVLRASINDLARCYNLTPLGI